MNPKYDAYIVDVLWILEGFGYPALVEGSSDDDLGYVLGTAIAACFRGGFSPMLAAITIWSGAMNAHKNIMKGVTIH